MPLLGVRPFFGDASEKKLVPADTVLFSDGMLGAPLVVSCEARQGLISATPPLLEPGEDSLEKMRCRVELGQSSF
jgi:hypothetical protein